MIRTLLVELLSGAGDKPIIGIAGGYLSERLVENCPKHPSQQNMRLKLSQKHLFITLVA